MSTRSNIAILRTDGTRTGIYCHYDGYIEGVGVTLQLAYNTAEKVEALLALGNLSRLGYYLEGGENDFACVAYHRDRGEGFAQSDDEQEFNYLFDETNGVWYVTCDTYSKRTFADLALGLHGHSENKEQLLLDAINGVDWREVGWVDDEFARADTIVDNCVDKALEGRKEARVRNLL